MSGLIKKQTEAIKKREPFQGSSALGKSSTRLGMIHNVSEG